MKAIDQTKFGSPDGNCWAACMASILEMPIDAMPPVVNGAGWWEAWQVWLHERNLTIYAMPVQDNPAPLGYTILSGKSPRGDWLHSVVAFNGVVVHDPHPDRSGIVSQDEWTVFAILDPVRPTVQSDPGD